MHLLSKAGCSVLSHATPMILSREKSVDSRLARGVMPYAGVGPMAAACVIPGLMTVVAARSSWQPPHTRDSFARPETHTGSLNSDMP